MLKTCDICGSSEIIETIEGFVCQSCGLVLDILRYEYCRPNNDEINQYSVSGYTQIGFKKERALMKNSVYLEQLSKLDARKDRNELIKTAGFIEIKRILAVLHFSLDDLYDIHDTFYRLWLQLGERTKYRNPEKLAPCVIYFYYKVRNKPISEQELLEIAKISKREFSAFKLSIMSFWPEYQRRNRQEYIIQRIMEITEHFSLGINFYYQSKKIFYWCYEYIKNTKDDVIVGVVTALSLLSAEEVNVKVSELCNRIGIRMSTIQRQVEQNIINRMHIGGFKSLVKSAGLLREIMKRIGLLSLHKNYFDTSIECQEKSVKIVEIKLDSKYSVFNTQSLLDYYFFIKRHSEFIGIYINRALIPLFKLELSARNESCRESINFNLFKVELLKYYYPVGPPIAIII